MSTDAGKYSQAGVFCYQVLPLSYDEWIIIFFDLLARLAQAGVELQAYLGTGILYNSTINQVSNFEACQCANQSRAPFTFT